MIDTNVMKIFQAELFAVDPFTKRRVERLLDWYIGQKVPRGLRDSVRLTYAWEYDAVTLREERPADDRRRTWSCLPIVRFRREAGRWRVYAPSGADQGADGWTPADRIAPDEAFERQLELVELDADGIFWTA